MSSKDFSGKWVLITGASSGIGAAMASEFARQGAGVIVTARRVARLEALARGIRAGGGDARVFECDVTRDEDLARLFKAIESEGLKVDVLVANAGFGVGGRFQDLSLVDFQRQFDTNVFGVLRTVYAGLEALRRTHGQIVVIGSVAGHIPSPGVTSYSMSKFAIRAFAQGLRGDLGREGIRVTLISPGYVDSDIRRTNRLGIVDPEAPDPIPGWLRVPTPRAAREIVAAVRRGDRERIVTCHGKLLVFTYRHMPWAINWVLDRGRRIGRHPESAPIKSSRTR